MYRQSKKMVITEQNLKRLIRRQLFEGVPGSDFGTNPAEQGIEGYDTQGMKNLKQEVTKGNNYIDASSLASRICPNIDQMVTFNTLKKLVENLYNAIDQAFNVDSYSSFVISPYSVEDSRTNFKISEQNARTVLVVCLGIGESQWTLKLGNAESNIDFLNIYNQKLNKSDDRLTDFSWKDLWKFILNKLLSVGSQNRKISGHDLELFNLHQFLLYEAQLDKIKGVNDRIIKRAKNQNSEMQKKLNNIIELVKKLKDADEADKTGINQELKKYSDRLVFLVKQLVFNRSASTSKELTDTEKNQVVGEIRSLLADTDGWGSWLKKKVTGESGGDDLEFDI